VQHVQDLSKGFSFSRGLKVSTTLNPYPMTYGLNGDEEYLPLWGRRAQNAGHAEVLYKFSQRLNNVVTEFCQSV
jgi:hypothetical protein